MFIITFSIFCSFSPSLAPRPACGSGILPAVSGGGGVSEVRVPEDGVLHDAAAFGGRGANSILRVLVKELQTQVFRE